MEKILITIIGIMLVVFIVLINNYRVKFKNCQDALKKETIKTDEYAKKVNELRCILSSVFMITEAKTIMKAHDFPFIAVDTDNITNIPLKSIKFTNKNGKVDKYINGIIKPFDGLICFNETYLESSLKKDLLALKNKYYNN